MISVEEALGRFLAPLKPLAAEQVAVSGGLGRVLAEDILSRRTQPPFAVSAMDGYAVRPAGVASVPAPLRILGPPPPRRALPGHGGARQARRHLPRPHGPAGP